MAVAAGKSACQSPAQDILESGPKSNEFAAVKSYTCESEEVLIAAAKRGDSEAFGELIERYRKSCLKRATAMMRNHTDAEDEVQTAFWKAFQRLDQFRAEGSFAAWLGRIVENQCLMRMRQSRNAWFEYLDESRDSNIRVELVCQSADPEDQAGRAEVVKLLRREVSRIPPVLRHVVLLRDLDQMPMRDVAVQLGLSIPAAKSRLMRGRTELRSRIMKHCGRKGAGTLMQMPRCLRTAYRRAA